MAGLVERDHPRLTAHVHGGLPRGSARAKIQAFAAAPPGGAVRY